MATCALPSRNGLTQMGHVSEGLSAFFGTLSNSSRKLSGTPFSSVGGSSAFSRSISIMLASRSPSPLLSSAGRPRIVSKALASRRNAAAIFSGCGRALAFVCARGSDVSTSSSCEKKVERSGRREGCCGLSSLEDMLCSTASGYHLNCACGRSDLPSYPDMVAIDSRSEAQIVVWAGAIAGWTYEATQSNASQSEPTTRASTRNDPAVA